MDRSIAKKRLAALDETITAHQINRQLTVWHDDGSHFLFTCCYFEVEGPYLFVIPEHHTPMLFHTDEVKFMLGPFE